VPRPTNVPLATGATPPKRNLSGFAQVARLTSLEVDIGLRCRGVTCKRRPLAATARKSTSRCETSLHFGRFRSYQNATSEERHSRTKGLLRLHPRKGKPVARLGRKTKGRMGWHAFAAQPSKHAADSAHAHAASRREHATPAEAWLPKGCWLPILIVPRAVGAAIEWIFRADERLISQD
jgi:hypothetical protein